MSGNKSVLIRDYINYLETQAQSAFNIHAIHVKALGEYAFEDMNIIERFMNRHLEKHLRVCAGLFDSLFSSYSRERMYAALLLSDREMVELSADNEYFSGKNRVMDLYEDLYGEVYTDDASQ